MKTQLKLSYICTITIYHLSPSLWQRKDPAFIERWRLLTEKSFEGQFEGVFIVELSFLEVMGQGAEQMVVRWSKVWRVWWMGKQSPSKLH